MATVWDEDVLWAKAVRYAERAAGEEREGPLFPLWSAMALEFVARAALAHIHPALLADPKDGANVLYVFGHGSTINPKSIPITTVFRRCVIIIDEFTEADAKIAVTLTERRNAEFHSGALPFEELPTRLWLADYFRLMNKLVIFQGKTLDDLLGDEAEAADTMIEGAEGAVMGEVQQTIAERRSHFEGLDEERQTERKRIGEAALRPFERCVTDTTCPSCKSTNAWVDGETVRIGDARLEDDQIHQEVVCLPVGLRCPVCELELRGYEQMHAADLGGQYSLTEQLDPVDIYGAAFDPADYYEDDYGND